MTQLALDFEATGRPPALAVRLADGTSSADLDLPEWIWTISLWRPYAGLVMAGRKTLETRTWPWPEAYGNTWLGIWAALHVDEEAMARLGDLAVAHVGPAQVLLGLVRVVGCRRLLPQDEPQSLFYAPDRWAWELERPLPLQREVKAADAGLTKLPQKFARVHRQVIVEALAA